MERHAFFTRHQKVDESIVEYATALENLSNSCDFKTLREGLLRDIFTCGLSENYKNVKERLLSEGDITWKKSLEIAKSMEMARANLVSIENGGQYEPMVAGIKNFNKTVQQKQQQSKQQEQQYFVTEYRKCGQKHKNKCPADGVICNLCGKKNHYARMCFTKRNGKFQNNKFVRNICEEDNSEEETLFMRSVGEVKQQKANIWNIEVRVDGKIITCQVDTGAQTNLMSFGTLENLGIPMVKKVFNNIVTFSGESHV